jgi:xylulose-5-phosphate/fructose-6-phosphate phosphoketolase
MRVRDRPPFLPRPQHARQRSTGGDPSMTAFPTCPQVRPILELRNPWMFQDGSTLKSGISPGVLGLINDYWLATNYLAAGQIYLRSNPLLKRPLEPSDIKPRPVGHWGTSPGLNLIYAHANRLIIEYDLNAIFIAGPGHGAPAIVANCYLEGTYSELYPHITQDEEGLGRFFRQFSFPGGISSHVAADIPGSINEGGELGYSLMHAYGAVFDNPDLLAFCVVGDGEAETGALATSWHSNKFINPARDGAVLPILHLNEYKISGPTVLGRMETPQLVDLFLGFGYHPFMIEGGDPMRIHLELALALDMAVATILRLQRDARASNDIRTARWPVILLNTPKGWTGPKAVDGRKVEGSFHAHQVPIENTRNDRRHLRLLEEWLRRYRPEELFDDSGRLRIDLKQLIPSGNRRMSANPNANGGELLKPLRVPTLNGYCVSVPRPGAVDTESTLIVGKMLRDVFRLNAEHNNFRIFSPDETSSNHLDPVFEATDRMLTTKITATDEHVSDEGRIMEVLSEHLCQGWLEGYLLTGRHGLFSSYEAFIHIVDSMFNQHAQWLKTSKQVNWRKPIASLNYLLTSHVWRQDHNGFSHQDPGFLDHVSNKKPEIVRIYLPPDANSLLWTTKKCLESRDLVNVIVAGKNAMPQWLTLAEAEQHCSAGLGIWEWASNSDGQMPDVVLAGCGDVPTLESLAAVQLLRRHLPELKVRFVNVIDLLALEHPSQHPHGISDERFAQIFSDDQPVIFAFHGYPHLIHRLIYRRPNHRNFHVHGYREEGTTTTPFDMVVINALDRFHLAKAAVARVPSREGQAAAFARAMDEHLQEHHSYIRARGEDLPAIRDWRWEATRSGNRDSVL